MSRTDSTVASISRKTTWLGCGDKVEVLQLFELLCSALRSAGVSKGDALSHLLEWSTLCREDEVMPAHVQC